MQTSFPTGPGWAGKFVVGVRMGAGGAERTGTVVLKRSYDIDAAAGTISPAAVALPVFDADQPYNLARNGDFEMPQPDPGDPWDAATVDEWTAETAPLAREAGAGITVAEAPDATAIAAAAKAQAAAPGRLVQGLTLDAPLAGRSFVLSLYAKTDAAPVPVAGIRLEEPGGATLCEITATLGATMQRYWAAGTWPATAAATELRIVLPTPTDPARTAYYDRVQLEERARVTQWNVETVLRYEHDLAPFKPEGDVIVLGYTDASYPGTPTMRCTVAVDGALRLDRGVARDAAGAVEKALFGWHPRADEPRKSEAGTWAPLPATPLPGDFDNVFFNGFARGGAAGGARPFPYLSAAAEVRVHRDTAPASPDYVFRLRGDTAAAAYAVHDGAGPDVPAHWRRVAVPMQLDTLVVEPDVNRCYAVWRGAWAFATYPESAYRLLAVEASA